MLSFTAYYYLPHWMTKVYNTSKLWERIVAISLDLFLTWVLGYRKETQLSIKVKDVHSITKDVDTFLASHLNHDLDNCNSLSERDWHAYKDAILLWCCTNHDLSILPLTSTLLWRVLHCICDSNCSWLLATLKKFDADMLKYAIRDDLQYESYKRSLADDNEKILFSAFKGVLKDSSLCVDDKFHKIHTSCCFMTRLSLRDREDLLEAAAAKYISENEFTSQGSVEGAALIDSWFPRTLENVHTLIDNTIMYVGNGPGTTADAGRFPVLKMHNMRFTQLQRYFLRNRGSDNKCDPGSVMDRMLRHAYDEQSTNVAKVVFVPKSAAALRTICMEHSGTMFLQQGAMRAILKFIGSKHGGIDHPLRRRINLKQQDLNRDLAYEGSLNGDFATIDLSSASDSVSWDLIAHWCDPTALREITHTLRSKTFSMGRDERVRRSNKYAPMGSALCFPMECIVFCAIVESALLKHGVNPNLSRYRTYGDDIIVETQYAQIVMDELILNGFKVNSDKSYYYPRSQEQPNVYRESCGGEYFNGKDVTPLRLSRQFLGFYNLKREPKAVEGLVDLCNSCFSMLPTVRRTTIRLMKEKLPNDCMPLFDDTGDSGLFSTQPTNFDKKRRINSDYQRIDIVHRVPTVVGSPVVDSNSLDDAPVDDTGAYALALLALDCSSRNSLLYPEDLISTSHDLTSETKWVVHYTPEYPE